MVVGKPGAGAVRAPRPTAPKRERPLVVGDRLDTDIEGAVGAGMDSLLVLTGVSTADDLAKTPAEHRPTYVADDLSRPVQPPDERTIAAASPRATSGVTVPGGALTSVNSAPP